MAASTTYTTLVRVKSLLPKTFSSTLLSDSTDTSYTSITTHIADVSRWVDADLGKHFVAFNSTTGTPPTPGAIIQIATWRTAARCLDQLMLGDRNSALGEKAQEFYEAAAMLVSRINNEAEQDEALTIIPDEAKSSETLTFGAGGAYDLTGEEAFINVQSLLTNVDIPTVICESVRLTTSGYTTRHYGRDYSVRFHPGHQKWVLRDHIGDFADEATPTISYRWSWRRWTWEQAAVGSSPGVFAGGW